MAQVSFQVLEGIEAGTVFNGLSTPITIGREEDNVIQLNDERISRFHAKIQDDVGRLILTDLESTNGTRVNGHPVKIRVLRPGDQIQVGRCLLAVGSPDDIDRSKHEFAERESGSDATQAGAKGQDIVEPIDAFPQGPPPLPQDLNTVQVAELATLLEYLRTEVLAVLRNGTDSKKVDDEAIYLSRTTWQRLQQLPPQVSRYLNQLAEPPGE